MIVVEVAYALNSKQTLCSVKVPDGCTVQQAIELSGILSIYPEIDLQQNKVGLWGKQCQLDTVLSPGNRIEIYRPLQIDPKQARLKRAKK